MADDDSTGLGLGGTLESWGHFIKWVGTPNIIALYVVFKLTNSYFGGDGLEGLNRKMELHAAALTQHEVTSSIRDVATNETMRRIQRLLARICVNTAKTDTDRQRCVADQ